MCGIAGIIQSSPDWYSKDHLKKMTDSLAHRGPDGEGLWQNGSGNVLLGHRRLSIIDLSDAGQQPMHYRSRYTIIHNGEIYNFVELKESLQKKGYVFRSQTDTEVIAASYDHWGSDCVDHFDGMFAFAIWDEQEKELFAARDRFGEKPFFYLYDPRDKLFWFASEMKAIRAMGYKGSPNLQMLFNFITIGYTDNPERPEETFDNQIQKLPPAHFLKISTGKSSWLSIEQYWDIDPEIQDPGITDEEALNKFTELFTTSVKRRLRSDVAVGTSLSGGLDSSSVIAMATSLTSPHSPLAAFTAVFPGFEKDESVHSKKVAETFRAQQYSVSISGNDLVNDWEKLAYHQDEPFGSASVYAQFRVFELAKQHDVKVLLDGQGADETLAGYTKYYKWYWQELFRKGRLIRSKELKAARALGIEEKFGWKNVIASYFPDIATVMLERQYLFKALQHEDLSRDFIRLQSREAYYTTPAYFTLNGVLYFNTCTHGLEELLRYADRSAMAHGREPRLPFLSHELVEFLFSLPAHFKIRNGWTKWLLRTAMDKKLPSEITWRKDKIGFEPPQKNWMMNEKMQDAIHEAKRKLIKENILKPGTLDKKIMPQSAHEPGNYDWRYLSAASLFK